MITVLLPTYNDEKYISETIKSVLSSDFNDFELLIINDGSTDNTLTKINDFDDPRIKLISKKNSGLIETLNYGFSIAKYEYIARIDGDDLMTSNRLSTQINLMKKNNYDLVGSNAIVIDENSDIIGKTNLPLNHNNIKKNLLSMKPSLIHPSLMIKRACVLNSGGYSNYFKHTEDYELWLRLIDKYKFQNCKQDLTLLRKHSKNISKVHINDQILNSYVAKFFYLNSKYEINEESFSSIKKNIESSFIFQILINSYNKKFRVKSKFFNLILSLIIMLLNKLSNLFLKRL
jgi:glycosyltransferase involved in cell wall biosynthesis